MAVVRVPKPEVVSPQAWTEIFYQTLVWKYISGFLDKSVTIEIA